MKRTVGIALFVLLLVACGPAPQPATPEPTLVPTVTAAPTLRPTPTTVLLSTGAMALLVRFQRVIPPLGLTYGEPLNYLPARSLDLPAVQDQADMRFLDEQGEPAGGISVLVHDASAADAVWEWLRDGLDAPVESNMPGGGRMMVTNVQCREYPGFSPFYSLAYAWQVNGVAVRVGLFLPSIDGPLVANYFSRLAIVTQVYFGD